MAGGMMARRSILRALAGVAVGGRSAAQAAVKATVEAVAPVGMSVIGGPTQPMPDSVSGMIKASRGSQSDIDYWTKQAAAFARVRALGIPDFIREGWEEEAAREGGVDIDIASLVSVSPAAKVLMQRKRSVARREANYDGWPKFQLRRLLWEQIHGELP